MLDATRLSAPASRDQIDDAILIKALVIADMPAATTKRTRDFCGAVARNLARAASFGRPLWLSSTAAASGTDVAESANVPPRGAFEDPVDVRTSARFLGVSASLVYAYVERKQIPHFRMMGRTIRFRLSELARWRQQFHVARNGGIDE